VHLSWFGAAAWSCAVAYFGVFLSPPIRKQVIVKEKLPFPSGTATAQLISVLYHLPPPSEPTLRHRHGYTPLDTNDVPATDSIDPIDPIVQDQIQPSTSWSYLSWSFLASGFMTLAAYFFPIVFSIPLFGSHLAKAWLWTFTPSLSYIGQGFIILLARVFCFLNLVHLVRHYYGIPYNFVHESSESSCCPLILYNNNLCFPRA